MSIFLTHRYSGRCYSAEETISFSQSPQTSLADVDREMAFHLGADHVQVSCLTQAEFDAFVTKYADRFKSIYFFQNPKVKDLSALSQLRNVEYLLFYNLRSAKGLWDMRGNASLKGILLGESCKNLIWDLSPIAHAPALEEFLVISPMDRKYTVRSLSPLLECRTLKRVMLDCNTENQDFDPASFSHLEHFQYRVDRKRSR
ncbi:MAG: hypothetical protein IJB91_06530 [Oscillospiraceae bacterium]|nr:hypothetical protein [Oscillospiraceae bacterium]